MKKTIIFLSISAISLVACNGGTSSGTSNSSAPANQLQQYIDLLNYTPEHGKQLTGTSQQQTFSTPGDTVLNSVTIKYYPGSYCSGNAVATTTLNGPSTPPAGTYSSSNASNYSLCGKYSREGSEGGCFGLYDDVSSTTPAVRSMQFTYNLANGVTTSQCLYNANNDPYEHGAFDSILNYSQTPPAACLNGSSCGFSQSYPTNSLFTEIALPQTGQLLCVYRELRSPIPVPAQQLLHRLVRMAMETLLPQATTFRME